ncbi:MAG: hypothetical protein OJF50_006605 [Nitrospira sp.]|nr:hypothetical protein [Nitrospira sp.]
MNTVETIQDHQHPVGSWFYRFLGRQKPPSVRPSALCEIPGGSSIRSHGYTQFARRVQSGYDTCSAAAWDLARWGRTTIRHRDRA